MSHSPTQSIVEKARISSATVVIQGVGIGMLSTIVPSLAIFITVLACYHLVGSYGIAIAAVGMLSTLGAILAADGFFFFFFCVYIIMFVLYLFNFALFILIVFDVCLLEAVEGRAFLRFANIWKKEGHITTATGKGFALGSAVLTALALISAFKTETQVSMIDVSNSAVLASALFGACLPYVFAALTMTAVGRVALSMIQEVRRQFVDCLLICSPLFIGYLLGAESLGGMLISCVASAFMLAVFMENAGEALCLSLSFLCLVLWLLWVVHCKSYHIHYTYRWNNATKFIEAAELGEHGKGSETHKAAVIGDIVGDPFK
ncbi:membrane-bound proton-translocating pyrophosphatase, partial [Reticulomyxa filosa]